MTQQKWSKGDKVIHASKPEWGTGEILQVEGISMDGKPCQRLVLRFDRAGMKTLSTAFAELKPAAQVVPTHFFAIPQATFENGDTPISLASTKEVQAAMTKLPESATDPFTTLKSRALASLKLYRFGEDPAALLDWAATQTGLKDPLARFNRHELEHHFQQFRMALDEHMKKLLRDLRRQEPAAYAELQGADLSPAARAALRRADAGR